jgi:hypothetical protein
MFQANFSAPCAFSKLPPSELDNQLGSRPSARDDWMVDYSNGSDNSIPLTKQEQRLCQAIDLARDSRDSLQAIDIRILSQLSPSTCSDRRPKFVRGRLEEGLWNRKDTQQIRGKCGLTRIGQERQNLVRKDKIWSGTSPRRLHTEASRGTNAWCAGETRQFQPVTQSRTENNPILRV